MALEVKGMHSSGTWLPATVESLTNQTILNDNGYIEYIPACGPVAQLGARFHGMEEVVGSIPTRSTIKSTTCKLPPFPLGVIWCQISKHLHRHSAAFEYLSSKSHHIRRR